MSAKFSRRDFLLSGAGASLLALSPELLAAPKGKAKSEAPAKKAPRGK